ncbi:MAG TPA: M1 family aminopeptidase, partial [Streptosporangiaceae bacterium]|nr:M1 family aminopeptidase [Streptosporangiaceae bacterium]
QLQAITNFESQFNGPFPFDTDGVVVGTPPASFEEEMQTMITFAGGRAGLSTLYHENMHQWWGDNVTESGYTMTFFKEGMATLAQYMLVARNAEIAAGGPGTAAGQAAFQASLIARFNTNYARSSSFWAEAPSNPMPVSLFDNSPTYARPATAYIALWQILGTDRFTKVLQHIQQTYGGGSITETKFEDAFQSGLPNKSAACRSLLGHFFTEWFDTAYPSGNAAKPDITGPGLAGPGFYGTHGGECKNV